MKKNSKSILIAEDEKPMAKALELKLTHAGYTAIAVNDGEQAIEELSKNKYDLLLLDLMMPKVDGFGVMEEIKNKKIKIKIVVLSNLSQEEDEAKSKAAGAMGFFVKSNTPINNIVEEVKKIIG